MGRGISVFFGLCLAALFIIGLAAPSWTAWLVWLDLVAAVAAFIAAGTIRTGMVAVGPVGTSIGVLVLWLIGLATGAQATQTWLNFLVGAVYLLVAITASTSAKVSSQTTTPPQWRKSA